jgi:hypothetical protein
MRDETLIKRKVNENVYIKFSEHVAFLEKCSSGTLDIETS